MIGSALATQAGPRRDSPRLVSSVATQGDVRQQLVVLLPGPLVKGRHSKQALGPASSGQGMDDTLYR